MKRITLPGAVRSALALTCSATLALSLGALAPAVSATATTPGPSANADPASSASVQRVPAHGSIAHPACSTVLPRGEAACTALLIPGPARADGPPAGALTPPQLQHAYRITGLAPHGTVAVVDAYGFPGLPRVLAVFRRFFGLGPCTEASGCLQVMNQRGGSDLPRFSLGWAIEEALDVETISAACPTCKILVVDADSPKVTDLGPAVALAAGQPGVVAIGNPYDTVGVGDQADRRFGHFFRHPGVAVVASSGDNGIIGPAYPADSAYVTAAGGTSLRQAHNARGWSERAWAQSGSGCSSLNHTFALQAHLHTGCGDMRAMSDVSAAADPSAGGLAWYGPVAPGVYLWGTSGGTSQSAVFIAVVYALSGNTAGLANRIPYRRPRHLFDVTAGFNGRGCTPHKLCHAGTGWDGPTGLGTPDGVASF